MEGWLALWLRWPTTPGCGSRIPPRPHLLSPPPPPFPTPAPLPPAGPGADRARAACVVRSPGQPSDDRRQRGRRHAHGAGPALLRPPLHLLCAAGRRPAAARCRPFFTTLRCLCAPRPGCACAAQLRLRPAACLRLPRSFYTRTHARTHTEPPTAAPPPAAAIVASIMALEGKAGEVPARLRRDLPDIVRSNWLLWVPFQFVNFRFVPPKLQASGAGAARAAVPCGRAGACGRVPCGRALCAQGRGRVLLPGSLPGGALGATAGVDNSRGLARLSPAAAGAGADGKCGGPGLEHLHVLEKPHVMGHTWLGLLSFLLSSSSRPTATWRPRRGRAVQAGRCRDGPPGQAALGQAFLLPWRRRAGRSQRAGLGSAGPSCHLAWPGAWPMFFHRN